MFGFINLNDLSDKELEELHEALDDASLVEAVQKEQARRKNFEEQ